METITYFASHYLVIAVISVILLALLLRFALRFVLPALGIRRELGRAVAQLGQIRARGAGANPEDLSAQVFGQGMLSGPWQEYRGALHELKDPDGPAGGPGTGMRSFAPASAFFTEQALVDTPLGTDFYKHLPGILTGLGIIGTFSGLIVGLVRFEASGDADRVRASLNGLIQSVGSSFVVSALAITLAMGFIWVEKSLTAGCYRLVEKLCGHLDGLFGAGAGEEHMVRLVRAAEASARHASEMKAMLASDLGTALAEIARWQAQTCALLKGTRAQAAPLAGEPGVAMLAADRLAAAVDALDARQQAHDERLAGLVESMGAMAKASQSSVSRTVETFTGELSGALAELMAGIREQSGQANRELGARQAQLAKLTGTAVGEISSQVNVLASEMRQASEAMRSSVASLSQITRESLAAFGSGAASLNSAVESFAQAGRGVSGTMAMAGKATERITLASANLTEAAAGVKAVMEDYGTMTRAFGSTVVELRGVIETARREASLASHIVERMEQAAEQLGIAELRAGEYLHGVTEVLASAHTEFAGNIERTLRKSNSQFHEELSKSVSLISGAIQDFGDVLDSVMEKGDVRCSA